MENLDVIYAVWLCEWIVMNLTPNWCEEIINFEAGDIYIYRNTLIIFFKNKFIFELLVQFKVKSFFLRCVIFE